MKEAVLIGATRKQKLPALVCEYTIRKHSSIEIMHSWDREPPEAKYPKSQSATGFSYVRFTLWERMNYEGLGIYVDSDMILFDDIKKIFGCVQPRTPDLYTTPGKQSVIACDCNGQIGVLSSDQIVRMVVSGEWKYGDVMSLRGFCPNYTIPSCWNDLDHYDEYTKLLHYTDMRKQPWVVHDKRPISRYWFNALKEAIAHGYVTRSIVKEEVELGNVIPELAKL